MHEDSDRVWWDNDEVEVVTRTLVRAVPDHTHDFVGDQDECVAEKSCRLTYGEHGAQQRMWEQEQADICSHCGHAEHCHTTSLPEERSKDYCTECQGKDEFHAFDEAPESPQEARRARMRALLASELPQGRVEAVVDVLMRLTQDADHS
jgi:hypothetical protein